VAAKRSIWWRLYHGETAFDFIGRKVRWFALSGMVILIGLIILMMMVPPLGYAFQRLLSAGEQAVFSLFSLR